MIDDDDRGSGIRKAAGNSAEPRDDLHVAILVDALESECFSERVNDKEREVVLAAVVFELGDGRVVERCGRSVVVEPLANNGIVDTEHAKPFDDDVLVVLEIDP